MEDLGGWLTARKSPIVLVTIALTALFLFALALVPAVQVVSGQPLAQVPTPTPTCAVPLGYGLQPTPTAMVPGFDQAAQNDPNTAYARPTYSPIARGIPTQYPGGTGITYIGVSASQPIPDRILKAIGWFEGWRKSSGTRWHQFDAPYGGFGYTLRSGCDYGVMQINQNSMAGMDSSRITNEYRYNIGAGARVLIDKWNYMSTPVYRLINPNNHTLAENWYYAVTAYNGWSDVNDPNYNLARPESQRHVASRPPYLEGDYASYNYPYQEIIWGYVAHPGSPPGGGQLWSPVRVPWVPRGIWGSWQSGDWRPAEWTPQPVFNYLPDIKANSGGWDAYIVVHNPRSDYTLGLDIALYNTDGSFYRW